MGVQDSFYLVTGGVLYIRCLGFSLIKHGGEGVIFKSEVPIVHITARSATRDHVSIKGVRGTVGQRYDDLLLGSK
jgi:hypothetical protein